MARGFLYRALRREEIDAGNVLIPKATTAFLADPRFGVDMTFPISFCAEINAVRQHQWRQNGWPTSGVSTTPHLERAKFYAKKHRVIARISIEECTKHGVRLLDVNQILSSRPLDIAIPEDEEVILVYQPGLPLPRQIIAALIRLSPTKAISLMTG